MKIYNLLTNIVSNKISFYQVIKPNYLDYCIELKVLYLDKVDNSFTSSIIILQTKLVNDIILKQVDQESILNYDNANEIECNIFDLINNFCLINNSKSVNYIYNSIEEVVVKLM